MMRLLAHIIWLTCGLTLVTIPALADDAPFLATDPASVLGGGEKALQQWIVIGHGHSGESYGALSSQTEFDYGVTDRLQTSLILLYDWSRTKVPGSPATTTSLVGLQGEVIWSVAKTDSSPLGIAIAIDPAFNPSTRAIAFRLLFTKYIAHFENVLNINFENNWDKDEFGHWQPSSAVTFNYGLAHAIDAHWTVGVEFGNEFAFSNSMTNADLTGASGTFFVGPTVQYDCKLATFSLGIQTQLPLSTANNAVSGYTPDVERWRLAFRVGHAI